MRTAQDCHERRLEGTTQFTMGIFYIERERGNAIMELLVATPVILFLSFAVLDLVMGYRERAQLLSSTAHAVRSACAELTPGEVEGGAPTVASLERIAERIGRAFEAERGAGDASLWLRLTAAQPIGDIGSRREPRLGAQFEWPRGLTSEITNKFRSRTRSVNDELAWYFNQGSMSTGPVQESPRLSISDPVLLPNPEGTPGWYVLVEVGAEPLPFSGSARVLGNDLKIESSELFRLRLDGCSL